MSSRFAEMVTKEIRVFCLWIFFTSLSNSTFFVNLPLYYAYRDNPTQATCSTNSKISTGTLNNSQVTPITRPPFLFSPYSLYLFLHMFTFHQSLLTFLSKVGSITNFKTLMTLYAQIKLLNSQTQF